MDANQGWTAKEAVRIITAMEDRGLAIDLVEQPVKAHDLEGMVYVTSRERVMGKYKNSMVRNVLGMGVFLISLVIGINSVISLF